MYFWVRILAQREEEFVCSLQSRTIRRASLQARILRKVAFLILTFFIPNSLFFLGFVMVSHFTICILFFRISGPPNKVSLNTINLSMDSSRNKNVLYKMVKNTTQESLGKSGSAIHVKEFGLPPS